METILLLIIFLCFFAGVYCIYQLFRNSKVYKIRYKWIHSDDTRWDLYSYDFMFDPSKHNLYGLKFPKDSDFPFL